jgi:WD40 repeat protein
VTDSEVITGGRDSMITVMSNDYQLLFTIDMSQVVGLNSSQVRAITLNSRKDRMWVGTFGHEIVELPIDFKTRSCNLSQAKVLINGHFAPKSTDTNEVWGLSIFRNQEKFVTCSDDAKIKIWDTQSHKLIQTIDLNLDRNG